MHRRTPAPEVPTSPDTALPTFVPRRLAPCARGLPMDSRMDCCVLMWPPFAQVSHQEGARGAETQMRSTSVEAGKGFNHFPYASVLHVGEQCLMFDVPRAQSSRARCMPDGTHTCVDVAHGMAHDHRRVLHAGTVALRTYIHSTTTVAICVSSIPQCASPCPFPSPPSVCLPLACFSNAQSRDRLPFLRVLGTSG